MRKLPAPFIVGALAALAGCDGGPGSSTDAEKVALANPQFAEPIMLHIGADAFVPAQAAASMNGVDDRPTYGASYNQINFRGCQVTTNLGNSGPAYEYSLSANFDEYRFQDEQVRSWLLRQALLSTTTYVIRYTHVDNPDRFGSQNTVQCSLLTDAIRRYLPPEMTTANIHAGLSFPALRRSFVEWTYRNEYETPFPGLGNVKMFAGTFTYSMAATVPGVASGLGTATVKVMLNPDTGKWQDAGFTLQDPALTLR